VTVRAIDEDGPGAADRDVAVGLPSRAAAEQQALRIMHGEGVSVGGTGELSTAGTSDEPRIQSMMDRIREDMQNSA